MKREQLIDEVRQLILSENPDIDIDNETDLFDDNLFDSFKVVSLVLSIENKYDISFEFEDLTEENLSTIHAIASLIAAKLPS